jgi:hypothetical protein
MMFRMTDSRPTSDWRPLALTLASLTAAYAVAYRLMPYDQSAYLPWPLGAWALYAGARLTTRVAVPLVIGVFFLSDAVLFVRGHTPPNYLFYVCLGVSLLLGRVLLTHSQAAWRIVAGGLVSYLVFFLATNTAAWLEPALPEYAPRTWDTWLLAMEKGLEFLRVWRPGHIIWCGDVLPGLALFGAHAYLAKAYFPAERVVPEAAR